MGSAPPVGRGRCQKGGLRRVPFSIGVWEKFTACEQQPLPGIARDTTEAATAPALGTLPRTLNSHRTSLVRKLEADSALSVVLLDSAAAFSPTVRTAPKTAST